MTEMVVPPHPAKFNDAVLDAIAPLLQRGWRVLDPMAGVGKVHLLAERCGVETTGVEIEELWARAHPDTLVGDARTLPFADGEFDAIVVSPPYANRMADAHNAQEKCTACAATGMIDGEFCPKCDGAGKRTYTRMTYRHQLGQPLHPDNGGKLQWGSKYKTFIREAWTEAVRVLRDDGVFVLNIKDHIRADRRQPVTAWHVMVLEDLGLHLGTVDRVVCSGMGYGANHDARIDYETVASLSRAFVQQRLEGIR